MLSSSATTWPFSHAKRFHHRHTPGHTITDCRASQPLRHATTHALRLSATWCCQRSWRDLCGMIITYVCQELRLASISSQPMHQCDASVLRFTATSTLAPPSHWRLDMQARGSTTLTLASSSCTVARACVRATICCVWLAIFLQWQLHHAPHAYAAAGDDIIPLCTHTRMSNPISQPGHPAVPITLVHRKGLVLDGSHPTLCIAYGAYGVPLDTCTCTDPCMHRHLITPQPMPWSTWHCCSGGGCWRSATCVGAGTWDLPGTSRGLA